MSVYRDPRSGYFTLDFRFQGRRIFRRTRLKTARDARQAEAQLRADMARHGAGLESARKIAFQEFAEREYLSWVRATHPSSPRTASRREVALRAPMRFFSGWMMDAFDGGAIEDFKRWRLSQTSPKTGNRIGPATVNRELDALRNLFGLAERKGMVKANPTRGVGLLREPDPPMRVVSAEEERRYLAAAGPRLRAVATLMLETGMRPEEIFRARWEDVHLMDGYIHVPFGKTRAARRNIPLTPLAMRVLAERLGKYGTRVFVFPSPRNPNRPMGTLQGPHSTALRRAKVAQFRLYDLRHTFATRAAQSGMDLPTLAKTLGHSKLNMVLRYAHPTPEHQVRAMAKLHDYVAELRGDSQQNSQRQNDRLN
jgi:integrase